MNEGPALALGSVFHQYRVTRYLGQGFHGQVFEVAHLHTGEGFALKLMHLEDRNDAKKVQRALTTAKGAYTIQHANVVKVHNLSCEPDGMVWMLMDLLTGHPLTRILSQGRPCSPLFALDVAIEIAWGLDAAHEVGIIHRDVKPDNVFITAEHAVKIIDFSIAKVIPAGMQTTRRGHGMGTAAYMAPDTIKGAEPDARVDVYSLGIVLWQMLAGYHPFHDAWNDANEMIRRQGFVEPGPLSLLLRLPEYLDVMMRRALAKDPDARFFSMAEFARAMQGVRDQLQADAAAHRIVLCRAQPGEPTLRNPLAHRENRSATVPEMGIPPRQPAERVVLQDDRAPEAMSATMPLPDALSRGGTTPLLASEMRDAIDSLTRASKPSVPHETPRSPSRMTPPERLSAPVVRPSHRARAFGLIVALALLALAITLVVVHRAPAVIAPSPALASVRAVATPEPEPVPAPAPLPSPVPPASIARPTVAIPTAPASVPTTSKPAPAPSMPPKRPKASPTADPPLKFHPLFGE